MNFGSHLSKNIFMKISVADDTSDNTRSVYLLTYIFLEYVAKEIMLIWELVWKIKDKYGQNCFINS